jgi:hypothetical protein
MEAFNRLFMQQRKGDLVLTGAFVPAERCKDYLMALADHFQTGAIRGHRGWYLRPRPTEKAEE